MTERARLGQEHRADDPSPVGAPARGRRSAARADAAALVLAVAWLAFFTALQWSVVRYRVPIVAVLTAATFGLGLWQWLGWRVRLTPPAVCGMLAGSALATAVVPLFSYLAPPGRAVATSALVVAPLAAAALLWPGRARRPAAAAVVAGLGYAVAGASAIVSDPAPKIDVWVVLQQGSDALARGESFYEVSWSGSPGVQDAFTYLPWTTVLLAPGRWLLGDVRWALLLWGLVAAAGVWALAHSSPGRPVDDPANRRVDGPGHRPADRASGAAPGTRHTAVAMTWRGAAAIALVLLAPGTLTQLDQSWTEPLLFAGLVWWAVLVRRGHAWWAVVPLALACASKQHLALLLPALLLWREFGARRALATGALTGALIAPWFLAGPADFVNDTITILVSFHPIRFANTLYLLALNTFGVALPFYVTGVAVLGTLAAVAWTVWRRQPSLEVLLRWLALVLLAANLFNKQAFYNQFWLAGALVVLSLAVPPPAASAAAPTDWLAGPGRGRREGFGGTGSAGRVRKAGWAGVSRRGGRGRPATTG